MAKCKVCGEQIPRGRIVCDRCTEELRMRAPASSEASMDTVLGCVPTKTLSKQKEAEDTIGHPNHYCEGRKFEPKDVIRDWNLNFNLGNAVKYISRNGRKDGNSALQDLKKARQYLDFEIEYIEKETK